MHIVDGRAIAREIEDEIRKNKSGSPKIVTVLVEGNEESELYAKLKERACARVGFESETLRFPGDSTGDEILKEIGKLNDAGDVDGIMVQLPVPGTDYSDVARAIDPSKDVEGVNPFNIGMTVLNNEVIVPCTPLAVMRILEHEGIDVKGKDVVIVNHSNIVGKPLAAMMLNRNATVSVCHVYTKKLADYTRRADIIVTGAGVRGLITGEHIREGSTVIDVGITKEGGGVYGDVDFDSVKGKAGMVTPVPGGVGPVTIACMLENALKLYNLGKN